MTTSSWFLANGQVIDLAQVAGAVAVDPSAIWLDGGPHSPSWLGLAATRQWQGSTLSVLTEIEEIWRRDGNALFLGWISYECGVEALCGNPLHLSDFPAICLRQYQSALWVDARGQATVIGGNDEVLRCLATAPLVEPMWPFAPLQPLWSYTHYAGCVAQILEEIAAGNTYQVNLSQRWLAKWQPQSHPSNSERLAQGAVAAYLALRMRAPAVRGALLPVGADRWVLSNSPETLMQVEPAADGRRRITSAPIKGTRPRGSDHAQDQRLKDELWASEKDRAEHVMIVDLVRNDLSKIAKIGSVAAPQEPICVSLPTVHHLVSEVSAELAPETGLEAIWRALFPGGSVTGAPKRKTVEIIASLEGEARGIYCGAIVALFAGRLIASIPIRTAMVDAAGLSLRSGGGIVADSDAAAEYAETLAKARAFAG